MNRFFARGLLAAAVITAAVITLGFSVLGCGNDDSNPVTPPGTTADVTIMIVANSGSNSFSPNPDTVSVGQKVAWRNMHSESHTATANGGAWDTGLISPNATCAAITMNTAGSFPYHCTPHPSMVATLVVIP